MLTTLTKTYCRTPKFGPNYDANRNDAVFCAATTPKAHAGKRTDFRGFSLVRFACRSLENSFTAPANAEFLAVTTAAQALSLFQRGLSLERSSCRSGGCPFTAPANAKFLP